MDLIDLDNNAIVRARAAINACWRCPTWRLTRAQPPSMYWDGLVAVHRETLEGGGGRDARRSEPAGPRCSRFHPTFGAPSNSGGLASVGTYAIWKAVGRPRRSPSWVRSGGRLRER